MHMIRIDRWYRWPSRRQWVKLLLVHLFWVQPLSQRGCRISVLVFERNTLFTHTNSFYVSFWCWWRYINCHNCKTSWPIWIIRACHFDEKYMICTVLQQSQNRRQYHCDSFREVGSQLYTVCMCSTPSQLQQRVDQSGQNKMYCMLPSATFRFTITFYDIYIPLLKIGTVWGTWSW